MRCVLIESPLRGENYKFTKAHEAYLEACLFDSLSRGEAPFASHALYPRVFDDKDPVQRKQGIEAGLEIGKRMDLTACYIDHGFSEGMYKGVAAAQEAGREIVYRRLFNLNELRVGSTESRGMPFAVVVCAVDVIQGRAWFRPVSWRGRGEALVVHLDTIDVAPPWRGECRPFHPLLADLQQADWEIVSPDAVLKERK